MEEIALLATATEREKSGLRRGVTIATAGSRSPKSQPCHPGEYRAGISFRSLGEKVWSANFEQLYSQSRHIRSAVALPEVFLKALNVARNLSCGGITDIVTINMDMREQYRPIQNVIVRPTLHSGKGYNLIGHHEIMVPLLVYALLAHLENPSGELAQGGIPAHRFYGEPECLLERALEFHLSPDYFPRCLHNRASSNVPLSSVICA